MKVIIFGVGNYYLEQKERLKSYSDIEILAYTDNNAALWGKKIDEVEIVSPDSIRQFQYDVIVIMSTYGAEIYHQLIGLRVEKKRILSWEKVCAVHEQGNIDIYPARQDWSNKKEKILIISTDLDYNGGSLAAAYAAISLMKGGNVSVVLAAPGGNKDFIQEITDWGIPIVICHALPYLFEAEKRWIQQFHMVIVNVFQMIPCACEISKRCPTLWWIHEPSIWYKPVIARYPDCIDVDRLSNINIYAVSQIAQRNFNKIFKNRITQTLAVGIPDMGKVEKDRKDRAKKLVFAMIGAVESLKAQDVFLDAVSKIGNLVQAEFWIIGKLSDNEYCHQIRDRASKLKSVRLLGKMNKKQIYDVFTEIDVVVCASREETLSMTIIEAMMFGKVCVTTDTTGIADYIENGVNGFVIPSNDVSVLAERMNWIAGHRNQASELGRAARRTFEQYFTLETLGRNMEKAIRETRQKWNQECVDY